MNIQSVAIAQESDVKKTQEKVADGATLEIPTTIPFEGFTYLKKEWIDSEDGIESVSISTAFSNVATPVNWDNMSTYVMMPEWGSTPLRRAWIIRTPTHLEGNEQYLFHYFFHIKYIDGSEKVSDSFTQLIMPKLIEYIDHSGDCIHIRLHWSLGNWSYPQDTEMEIRGIEWESEFSVSHASYRINDPLYEHGRAMKIAKLEKPRVFHGQIWAPRGEEVNYCFNLAFMDTNGKLAQKWDNNDGENFRIII